MNKYGFFIGFILITYMFSLKDKTASEVRNRFVGTGIIALIITLLIN